MSKKMESAYAALRAKDEIEASQPVFWAAALVLCAMGVFSICAKAWLVAAIALLSALVLAWGPRLACRMLRKTIHSTGYTEVELERANLA